MSMSPRLYLPFFFLLIHFFVVPSFARPAKNIHICNQPYALCTSAACIPDPRHPHYAICTCVVEQGNSAGYTSCEKRLPQHLKNRSTQLTSTFSFVQFSSKKSLKLSLRLSLDKLC